MKLPPSYRRQLDVATFWRISRSIRLNQKPPEIVDHEIAVYLSRPKDKVSTWLETNLEELRELNKKRFKS